MERPVNQYLQQQLDIGRDESLYNNLADFNPLGLGMAKLSPEQKAKFENAGLSASEFEARGPLANWFPKLALSDALSKKREEARTQIRPALAAQKYQYDQQEYLMNRAQRERTEDAKMQFDFGSKIAERQGLLAERLADKQGRMNLRAANTNAAATRQFAPVWK